MKYIMTIQHGSMDEILYQDIIRQPNVKLFYVSEPLKNSLLYKVRRIHTSMPATKYFEPPFKPIWYEKILMKIIKGETCIIFQAATAIHIGMETLRHIRKKKPHAKMVLFLLDSIHAHSITMMYAKRYIFDFEWDMIFTFDKSDSEEFGFRYMGYSYYSRIDVHKNAHEASDLYYIGALKKENSRTKILLDVFRKCKNKGVNCNFKFLSPQPDQTMSRQGIKILSTPQHYTQVLQDTVSSKCILELVQPGQKNQTARYMEAVCYNKKLLTNNQYLDKLPYYNERYMKIFRSVEEIDPEWIKNDEVVDYHYQGDFSPLKLLNTMEEVWK